jgi:NADPH:quinone reductase-like Zn-dependent oxidoreductase
MKAWIYRRYGGPEVLEWAEVDTPIPGADEIRIRVVAAALNPLDWKRVDGQFKFMTLGRLPRGVGFDVAGEVDAVGPGVSSFQVGDAVVAAVHPMGSRQGTVAEFVCTRVGHSAAKPAAVDCSATDWRRLGERFDFVFDCSGTTRYADVAPLLADDGAYAHVLPGAAICIRAWWLGATSKRREFGDRPRIIP